MLRQKLSALSPATLRHRASLRSSRHVRVPAFVACNSPCAAQKAGDLPPGKSRSTYTSIGLRYPAAPKPGAAIHGCPSNACVGPRVFHAPEKKFGAPLEVCKTSCDGLASGGWCGSLSAMPGLGATDKCEADVASHDQQAAVLFQAHFASIHHS
jgi:hypothetical protein